MIKCNNIIFNCGSTTTKFKNIDYIFNKLINYNFCTTFNSWKKISIPLNKIDISFSKSGGAGGQNVNKLNTKVEFRFNLSQADWIADDVKLRIKNLYPNKINSDGYFILTSQEHRTQEENRVEAQKKLQMILFEASQPANIRIIEPFQESDEQKNRRIKEKKQRSDTKHRRRNSNDD
jgi:protein subunit release factor B